MPHVGYWHGSDVEPEGRRPEGSTSLPCQKPTCGTRIARAITNTYTARKRDVELLNDVGKAGCMHQIHSLVQMEVELEAHAEFTLFKCSVMLSTVEIMEVN